MARTPLPTAPQWGLIILGAVIAAGLTLFFGISGMIGGLIIGVGTALGAIPYQRAVQQHRKSQGGS